MHALCLYFITNIIYTIINFLRTIAIVIRQALSRFSKYVLFTFEVNALFYDENKLVLQ